MNGTGSHLKFGDRRPPSVRTSPRDADARLEETLPDLHTLRLGSASELEYHLLMAADLQILGPDVYRPLEESVTRVKKMLTGLIRRLMTDNR